MMLDAMLRWSKKPACPWEFWLPQSGPIGGLVLSLIGLGFWFGVAWLA